MVRYPSFFNGAVPSFGALESRFLIVGLAPGLKGANATGRPFTGDFAGDVLYPALVKAGFAVQLVDAEGSEGEPSGAVLQSDLYRGENLGGDYGALELRDCRITNAVRCVPPENKPTTEEITNCSAFLQQEIAAMPNLQLILTLGLVSHKAVLRAFGMKQSAFAFGHAAVHELNDHVRLVNSYHTSRYNMNTGRLSFAMFDAVMAQAKEMVANNGV